MDKKVLEQENKVKTKEKKKPVKKEKAPKVVKAPKVGLYISYGFRVIMFGLLFGILFGCSYLLVMKSLSFNEAKTLSYTDGGNIDYKVYLKPNDFYEQPYLGKNMVYVSGLIKNVSADFSYQFMLNDSYDMDFNYSIIGTLQISDDSGANVYYSKDYTLLKNTQIKAQDKSSHNIRETITIDYDYYNNLANKFKSSYGLDAKSNLVITFKVNKNVEKLNINESNSMTMTIPLSQRAINIKTDTASINNTKSITSESSVTLSNKLLVGIAAVLFIGSVAMLLRFLELVFMSFEKKSEYDKYLDKIFKEYDRLIVETKTMPRFDDKNIIKIEKFEELLDARDTLKQPIMYFNISSHNKCYFYINKGKDTYLTVLKAVDLEAKNEKKKKSRKEK